MVSQDELSGLKRGNAPRTGAQKKSFDITLCQGVKCLMQHLLWIMLTQENLIWIEGIKC